MCCILMATMYKIQAAAVQRTMEKAKKIQRGLVQVSDDSPPLPISPIWPRVGMTTFMLSTLKIAATAARRNEMYISGWTE